MIEFDDTLEEQESAAPRHVSEIVDADYVETAVTADLFDGNGQGVETQGEQDTHDSTRDSAPSTPIEEPDRGSPPASDAIVSHSVAIETPETLASLATEEQIETAIRRIVMRTKAIKQFKAAMLGLTNVRDWYSHAAEGDEDGIPYLAESGAEKLINAFEIEVEHDGGSRDVQPSDIGGYEFVYVGRMRSLVFSTTWLPVIGSRWSEDGFFTRGGSRTPDPGDVRKAAHTNFLNRGIKSVCGLKTITWEELEQLPGLEDIRHRCIRIGYGSGKGDNRSGGGQPSAAPGEVHELCKGPHIAVKIDKEDLDSRNTIKTIPAKDRAWIKGEWYWAIRYNKRYLGIIMDMYAQNSAVKYKLINVAKGDLP